MLIILQIIKFLRKSAAIFLLISLILMLSFNLYAMKINPKIYCVHRQVCNLIYSLNINIKKINIVPILLGNSDPHHKTLKIKTIKKILQAKYLFLPPKKLINKFQNLQFKHHYYFLNWNGNQHFWLDSSSICILRRQIINQLKLWKLINKTDQILCRAPLLKIDFTKLKANTLIVLSHHALKQIFIKNFEVLVISSEHGQIGLNASKMKKIINHLKQKSILFIEEKQIPLPKLPFSGSLNASNHLKINSLGKLHESPYLILEKINHLLNPNQEVKH